MTLLIVFLHSWGFVFFLDFMWRSAGVYQGAKWVNETAFVLVGVKLIQAGGECVVVIIDQISRVIRGRGRRESLRGCVSRRNPHEEGEAGEMWLLL